MILLLLAIAVAGCAGGPTYLQGFGYTGEREATLGWVLLIIASVVALAVTALVLAAVFRRRSADGLVRNSGGMTWILAGGVVVPAVVLLGVLSYGLAVMAEIARPASRPAVTLEVVGHRWWWEVRYFGGSPGDRFTTANEIHIPVGVPVRLQLTTGDVIHSFWIPQLAGKMDLIPGQMNVTWIEADSAGTYWGHCGEYCGLQHANMMMSVVAESRGDYDRWAAAQRGPAATPTEAEAAEGMRVFEGSPCASCHTVRGTPAGGALGPDLTHVASRAMLAAGVLPNTRGHLAGWIGNPHGIKPGVVMPAVPLDPGELHAVVAYLESLR